MSQNKKCPAVFLRGGDHLLLDGMTLMLWRGLLWQQWLRWWRRESTCFHSYGKWGCVGIHGRVREREWEMYIYAETNRSRNADGLVICALPCQKKDMSGPHLSSQRPYIACHTGQTNKKGKDCTQMPRIKKKFCHLACLPVFWVVAYHESNEPFNKLL